MLQRRQRVAELYLTQHTQWEIARRLGINQSNVSRHLKALREEWQQSALMDFNARKAEELAKIDQLERDARRAWKRSKRTKEIETAHTKKSRRRGEESEASLRKEPSAGDAKFLSVVQWCINKRCEILGLNAPKQFTTPPGQPLQVQEIPPTPEQERDELKELTDQYRKRMTGAVGLMLSPSEN